MDDLSKYQVYTDAMELANAVMKSHGHYTREFKYTLGNETVTKALALIDCVVRGLNGYDKKRKQRNYLDAIDLTQEIESRILLAADNQCIDNEHAGWYIDEEQWLKVTIKAGYRKSDYYKFLAKKRKKQLFNHQTT